MELLIIFVEVTLGTHCIERIKGITKLGNNCKYNTVYKILNTIYRSSCVYIYFLPVLSFTLSFEIPISIIYFDKTESYVCTFASNFAFRSVFFAIPRSPPSCWLSSFRNWISFKNVIFLLCFTTNSILKKMKLKTKVETWNKKLKVICYRSISKFALKVDINIFSKTFYPGWFFYMGH